MTFDLVQAVPWGLSGASAFVAGLAYRRTVRTQAVEERRKLTEMASNFAVWLDYRKVDKKHEITVVYNNRNAVPMTDVIVGLDEIDDEDAWPLYAAVLAPTSEPRRVNDLNDNLHERLQQQLAGEPPWKHPKQRPEPREYLTHEAKRASLSDIHIEFVAFTDGAGARWVRDARGALTKPSLDHLHHWIARARPPWM